MQATGSKLVCSSLNTGNKERHLYTEELNVTNCYEYHRSSGLANSRCRDVPGPLNLQKEK